MSEYFFKVPFGESGDRDNVPRSTQSDGSVSYAQGWGPDYQKNLKTQATAKAVSRKATNQLLYAITQALGQYQRYGVPSFIASTDNDGAAFAYAQGAEVIYNGQYWVSLQANNTTTPGTGNGWQTVLYRVATDLEVETGTDSRTFIVPSNLKTQLDARDRVINESIEALRQTVAQNKSDQGQVNEAISGTVSENKTTTDAAIKKLSERTAALEKACPFPIGFVMGLLGESTSPKETWPDTDWENMADQFNGRFLRVSNDTSASTGGSEEVVIAATNLPDHIHRGGDMAPGATWDDTNTHGTDNQKTARRGYTQGTFSPNVEETTNAPIKVLNPYVNVIFWRRTA